MFVFSSTQSKMILYSEGFDQKETIKMFHLCLLLDFCLSVPCSETWKKLAREWLCLYLQFLIVTRKHFLASCEFCRSKGIWSVIRRKAITAAAWFSFYLTTSNVPIFTTSMSGSIVCCPEKPKTESRCWQMMAEYGYLWSNEQEEEEQQI